MAEPAKRMEPLADRMFAMNGVNLEPIEACERVSLRAGEEAIIPLGASLGLELPTLPGTVSSNGAIHALWIGPDEWYLTAPYGTGIEDKLNGADSAVFSKVAIDHRNTGLIISGSNAVNALNSGCPRDLSLDAFPVGSASRTLLAKAEIILWRIAEDRFRIECWRSFSDYVWKYLISAARSA